VQTIYISAAQEKKEAQEEWRSERIHDIYFRDAYPISSALLAYAKSRYFIRANGLRCYGELPSQQEINGGCLNAYPGGKLAQSYSRRGILRMTWPDIGASLGVNNNQYGEPDNPCGIYGVSQTDIAHLFDGGKVVVYIMADGKLSS